MTPRRIAIAGWLVFLLYAYPGYMKADAIDQLVDARTGLFMDWHSPMMTELWRLVERAVAGPAGMLFVQSLLLLAGTYHLMRRWTSDRAAAITAVCVLLFPPILGTTALVSAEAQLASFLIAGTAALTSSRRAIRLAGLALMIVACGMHDGGAPAALPIIVATFCWHAHQPRWQRIATALAAWLVVIAAARGIDVLLVDGVTEHNEVALATSDILGTLRDAPDLGDAELQHLFAGTPLASSTEIQRHAREGDARIFDPAETAGQREALLDARYALARRAPAAYLAHRWRVFRGVLGSRWWPLYTDFVPNVESRATIRHAARHSLVQRILIGGVRPLAHTFLFRPHFYLILAIILLPLSAIRRRRDAAALLASAILYELSLMILATRAEFRDSHWMIVATTIAVVMLVIRRSRDMTAPRADHDESQAERGVDRAA